MSSTINLTWLPGTETSSAQWWLWWWWRW